MQTVARWAGVVVAVLFGAGDADMLRPARALSLGAGSSGAFIFLISAAVAETAVTRQTPMLAQAGQQTYPGGSLTSLFQNGGLLGGFAAGFLGSGLLGLLFGRGLLGGLGSAPSYLGLIFQLALLAMLCRLIWTRWRGGDAAHFAARSSRQLADPYLRSRDDLHAGRDSWAGMKKEIVTPDPVDPGAHTSELTDTGERD
jgi:hypothetical protein